MTKLTQSFYQQLLQSHLGEQIIHRRNLLVIILYWISIFSGSLAVYVAEMDFELIYIMLGINGTSNLIITIFYINKRYTFLIQYLVMLSLMLMIFLMSFVNPIINVYLLIYYTLALVTIYHNIINILICGIIGVSLTYFFYQTPEIRIKMFSEMILPEFIPLMLILFLVMTILATQAWLGQRAYKKLKEVNEDLKKLNQSISRFVPYDILTFLNKNSIQDVELGDHTQKNMSILFSDIRHFTTMSEKLTPDEVFRFLNHYFGIMEPTITKNRGFIDKYIGDAIMAVFDGEPLLAVKTAISMLEELKAFNQSRLASGQSEIKIGIGINTGNMILGTVGGNNRMEGTVISDAVNLASRIEGLTKYYNVPLLISQFTYQNINYDHTILTRFIDQVTVKGKTEQIKIYEVYNADADELKELKKLYADDYQLAISYFFDEKFKQSKDLFLQLSNKMPQDLVIQRYLKKCEATAAH